MFSLQTIKNWARYWATPVPLFWLMPWLMVLLTLATIQQGNIGLYDAVQTYLYDPILWWFFIPLPGGGITLGLIYFSLLLKFLFYSAWQRKRVGIILSHFGILILMTGGIVTALYQKEGYVILEEGQQKSFYNDYQKRVLKIQNNEEKVVYYFDNLKKDQKLSIDGTPISLSILDKCENCDVINRQEKNEAAKGIAKNIELKSKKSELNKEVNFSGIALNINIKENKKDSGTYILLEDAPKNLTFGETEITLTREETPLPFTIELLDFEKIDYPGTRKAADYQSDLIIHDSDLSWPAFIKMNEPYRYKGYTLYQSSFDMTEGKEISVLNVVKNRGSFFPYLSSAIIFFGLFIHLFIRIYRAKERRKS